MNQKTEPKTTKKSTSYTIEDAMKITNDIFNLNKENNYNPGAFVHGLIFAMEAVQKSYNIPPKQLAEIKRDCRKYFKLMEESHQSSKL